MALLAGIFSVFSFGVVIVFLGSVKLKLASRIQADDAQFGKIVAVFQWTMVVMAILGGIAIDNFGHQVVIVAGIILSATAIFLVGQSQSLPSVMGACVVLGIGGQFVNLGGNTLIPSLFEDPSAGSNIGNTFFGLGALLVPILTVYLFQKTGFGKSMTVVAGALLALVVVALLATFPETEKSFSPQVAVALLGNYVTWISALTLFCYVGLEVSMAVWITTYASELGADEGQAARSLSLFYVAIMFSRLLFGLQDKVTGIDLTPMGGYVLSGGAVVAAIAITIMIGARDLSVGRKAIALTGLVFGPIFPTTVGVTFQHFPASQWGTLFGIVFAVGLIGSSLLPAWIGQLAKDKSVQSGLNILRGTAVALAIVAFVLGALPVRG